MEDGLVSMLHIKIKQSIDSQSSFKSMGGVLGVFKSEESVRVLIGIFIGYSFKYSRCPELGDFCVYI